MQLTPQEFYELSSGFDFSPVQGHADMNAVFSFAEAYAQHVEETAWVNACERTPDLIEGEDYSENVFAICEGLSGIQVMCLCWNPSEDDAERGYFWANAYGKIDGECEFDDDYKVTHWQSLPTTPKQ